MKLSDISPYGLPPKFESFSKAKKERAKRIKILKESPHYVEPELRVKLANCKKGKRCNSAACPVCQRRIRMHLIRLFSSVMHDKTEWSVVTIIFYEKILTTKQLEELNPTIYKDRLRKQLKASGIDVFAYGTIELDFHPELNGWLAHAHLVIHTTNAKKLKRLKRFYRKKIT